MTRLDDLLEAEALFYVLPSQVSQALLILFRSFFTLSAESPARTGVGRAINRKRMIEKKENLSLLVLVGKPPLVHSIRPSVGWEDRSPIRI